MSTRALSATLHECVPLGVRVGLLKLSAPDATEPRADRVGRLAPAECRSAGVLYVSTLYTDRRYPDDQRLQSLPYWSTEIHACTFFYMRKPFEAKVSEAKAAVGDLRTVSHRVAAAAESQATLNIALTMVCCAALLVAVLAVQDAGAGR